jgi:hypothetical protein
MTTPPLAPFSRSKNSTANNTIRFLRIIAENNLKLKNMYQPYDSLSQDERDWQDQCTRNRLNIEDLWFDNTVIMLAIILYSPTLTMKKVYLEDTAKQDAITKNYATAEKLRDSIPIEVYLLICEYLCPNHRHQTKAKLKAIKIGGFFDTKRFVGYSEPPVQSIVQSDNPNNKYRAGAEAKTIKTGSLLDKKRFTTHSVRLIKPIAEPNIIEEDSRANLEALLYDKPINNKPTAEPALTRPETPDEPRRANSCCIS